jgi:UDP-2,3-diacylglucosamine pyrophosphatase LpxH
MEKRAVDVVVLSDLHLGTYGCRAKEVITYLKSIQPQLLILNGDIIDIWQFSKHYFPAAHVAVIKEILGLITSGTRVIYVTGNHDELLRRYSDLQVGHFQLTDKLVIEINHKMTWIFHGDVFDNTTKGAAKFWAKLGSNGYAMLLGFNRCINSVLKIVGRERISLSKNIMKKLNQSFIKINRFENLIAELAIEKKYDFVICGHIHQPQKRMISNKNGSVVYLNAGDWVEHLTALEYHNNDWQIYTYDENTIKASIIKDMKQQPTDVITDQIAIFLHSLGA